MAEPNQTEQSTAEEDEELSALLDSAVKDLGASEVKGDDKKDEETNKSSTAAKPTPPDTLWTDDFLRTTSSRFDQNMSALFSPGTDGSFNMEQLSENIQRLAEASTQAAGFESSPDNEFSSIIAQTLRNLAENAENIQSQFSEDDLMSMLGSLGNLPDNNSDPGELLPYMQKMMQSMLSKEFLAPSLAGIIEKYPAWLEENKSKISEEELARYMKQLNLMKQVCAELDKESPQDSEQVKTARFDQVLGLLQEMQDCGQPPAELVGNLDAILGSQGQPQIPPGMSPEQCTIQ